MPYSIRSLLPAVPAAWLVLSLTGSAEGQPGEGELEDDLDRTPRDCVVVSRIERTEVLDDRTVLFHLRGRREAYRNYLPRRCPGLERNDRFMYQVTGNRLCSVDTITVLEQFAGSPQRGFTCRLGLFHPITREEIEELKLLREGGDGAIESRPVELPPEDGDAEEEEAP
jgi:hypothetical protein